ncbi:hypothetical protein MUN89_12820 [Halobacillus salinarum]|uniref:SHSP domain-containing protein n=1 Tax=Halobacillus salinarum TaxID=2932257 RepID=A0ABY4EFE0_9BACI|nr:hypothetical protein [Halobacillus salinarum]UOQ42844.1 hypothetical protein MUN89_12820 [Halobacillus salinarum]
MRIIVEDSKITEYVNESSSTSNKQQSLQRMERFITLPFIISESKTHVSYTNGVLRIVTPNHHPRGRYIE